MKNVHLFFVLTIYISIQSLLVSHVARLEEQDRELIAQLTENQKINADMWAMERAGRK